MKIKHSIFSLMNVGLCACILSACVTAERKEAKLEAQAKVTRTDAEKIALAKVPAGTIKEGEIEKENGKLIWSFDIATPRKQGHHRSAGGRGEWHYCGH